MFKIGKEYQLFKDFIDKIDVNDRSERGVKLNKKYLESAHSNGDLQDLQLVVNEQKIQLPNLNKVVNYFLF